MSDSTVWVFLLAAVDQQINDDNWEANPQWKQSSILAGLLNEQFPKLKIEFQIVRSRFTILHKKYAKEDTKSADLYITGSRCLDIEKFEPNDRDYRCPNLHQTR
jgi:hypothetical protein